MYVVDFLFKKNRKIVSTSPGPLEGPFNINAINERL